MPNHPQTNGAKKAISKGLRAHHYHKPGGTKTKVIAIRVTDNEWNSIRKLADDASLTVTDLILQSLGVDNTKRSIKAALSKLTEHEKELLKLK